jgi:ribosomal protein L37E
MYRDITNVEYAVCGYTAKLESQEWAKKKKRFKEKFVR